MIILSLYALAVGAPIFIDKFVEQTLEPGREVSLKCIASGNPLPQVTWSLDGYPIPDTSSRFRTGDYVTPVGLLVSYVNITSIVTEDGGLYQCKASNGIGTVGHSARLRIFGPPMVRPMRNVSAVAGEPLMVTCPVGGHPIEGIFWELNGVRLPYNHRQKVFPNGTLLVADVERLSDEGKYKCVATGKDGKFSSNSLAVNVLSKFHSESNTFRR